MSRQRDIASAIYGAESARIRRELAELRDELAGQLAPGRAIALSPEHTPEDPDPDLDLTEST